MKITDVAKLNEHYNALFRAGDLEGLVGLYDRDAVLVPAAGTRLAGREQIRGQLRGLLALAGELSAVQLSCVQQDDMALLHAQWRFAGKDAAGHPLEMSGRSSRVARRDAGGAWRYVIDMPFALPGGG